MNKFRHKRRNWILSQRKLDLKPVHDMVAWLCRVTETNFDAFICNEMEKHHSAQWTWRLNASPPPAVTNGILQQVRHLNWFIDHYFYSFFEKKLGLYWLHGRCSCLKAFIMMMCLIFKSKFISYVSTTQFALPWNINRISLEAQVWGLLYNCGRLTCVCNVPLCGLGLLYTSKEEYIVISCHTRNRRSYLVSVKLIIFLCSFSVSVSKVT